MSRLGLLSLLSAFLLSACLGGTSGPAPVTHYGQSEGAGSAGIHTVGKNETLWKIAKHYKLAMPDIAEANGLVSPFTLNRGQRLRLPPPRTYAVKEGDTLSEIARLFDVNMTQIARQNNLRSPYALEVGQSLRMPKMSHEEAVAKNKSIRRFWQKPAISTAKKPIKSKVYAKAPPRSSSKFMKPVEGPLLSSYGAKKGGRHNDGINIKAPRGAPVRAAENGVVVYAGNELKGSGNLVLLRHDNRWMTAYAHMDKILIKRGQVLKRGETIGTVGSTGSVSSPQLHFEVRKGTKAINPAKYLR